MNGKVVGLLVAAIVIIVALVTMGLRSRPQAAAPVAASPTPAGAQAVTAQPPRLQEVPDSLSVTGSISARDELSIGAEVNGLRITQVEVDEGSRVSRGQTLATLDRAVLEAELHEAQARLDEAHAASRKAVQPNRPQDIAGMQHGLFQARANLEETQASLAQAVATRKNADLNLQRYAELLHEDYATQQEYTDHVAEAERDRAAVRAAEDQVQAARAALQQAQDRLSLVQAGGRQEDVAMAQASAEEAAATVEQLQAQLAQTVIQAPDDGLIVKRDAHLGDITMAGKPLFTMVRRDELELRAQVGENDLARVHIGQAVELTTEGHTVHGRVRLITPTIDASTRLATVRIAVPTEAGLMPGMFVHAHLELGTTRAMLVPADAVLGSAEQPYVFVLDGGVAHRRAVTLGRRLPDSVEIASGITPTDRVIVAGAAFLTDGDAVTTP